MWDAISHLNSKGIIVSEKDYAADWLKKSFTTNGGEKIIFNNKNLIDIFYGLGYGYALRFKFDWQTGAFRLASRARTVPSSTDNALKEAMEFRGK